MKLGLASKVKKLDKLAREKYQSGVMILDLIDGKYYFNNTEIDLSKISATVVIFNDIPRPPKQKGDE